MYTTGRLPLLQDYPSVKHVGDMLRQQDIIPIFGTVENTIPVYEVQTNECVLMVVLQYVCI